jgi:sRNA-binding carbon storage regulator CsrA
MLVLAGRKDSVFLLSNGVIITVVESSGARLRLGFDAPEGVQVARLEVAHKFGPEVQALAEKVRGRTKRAKGE